MTIIVGESMNYEVDTDIDFIIYNIDRALENGSPFIEIKTANERRLIRIDRMQEVIEVKE